MDFTILFTFLGGLGLFIYGMTQMGEGLQKTAGKRLKRFIAVLTSNPLMGILVGTGVTTIVQSSSATTVMVVGFVNAGLMTLAQSIGVIMGANIGTTVTAQMIAFDLGEYALHFIAIGVFSQFFAKSKKIKYIGQVLFGFGILFLGMTTMSDAMRPLRDSPAFFDLMEQFGQYPILGVLIGAGVTVAVQSSTAAMGILLGLFSVGAISFQAGIPIILGSNIGTTITAILSAIGANLSAKRSAVAHCIFNIVGSLFVVVLLYIIPNFAAHMENVIIRFSEFIGGTPTPERLVANTHTLFNIANTLIWIPFIGALVKFIERVIPGEDKSIKRGLRFIDERMIETPGVAVNQLNNEVSRMFSITKKMVNETTEAFMNEDIKLVEKVQKKEKIVDELEEELLVFLTRIPQARLSEEDIQTIDMYFAVIDAIESIGDDADEIAELVRYKKEEKIKFSDDAEESIRDCFLFILDIMEKTERLLKDSDMTVMNDIFASELKMDEWELKYRNQHLKRLSEDRCVPSAGIVYLEMLDSLENISDQSADIAHSINEKSNLGYVGIN